MGRTVYFGIRSHRPVLHDDPGCASFPELVVGGDQELIEAMPIEWDRCGNCLDASNKYQRQASKSKPNVLGD